MPGHAPILDYAAGSHDTRRRSRLAVASFGVLLLSVTVAGVLFAAHVWIDNDLLCCHAEDLAYLAFIGLPILSFFVSLAAFLRVLTGGTQVRGLLWTVPGLICGGPLTVLGLFLLAALRV